MLATAALTASTVSGCATPCPLPVPLVNHDEVLQISLSDGCLMSVRDEAERWVTETLDEISGCGDWLITVLVNGKKGMTREQLVAAVSEFLTILHTSSPLTDPEGEGEDCFPCTIWTLNGNQVLGYEFWR